MYALTRLNIFVLVYRAIIFIRLSKLTTMSFQKLKNVFIEKRANLKRLLLNTSLQANCNFIEVYSVAKATTAFFCGSPQLFFEKSVYNHFKHFVNR